jgi:hypothetical protein
VVSELHDAALRAGVYQFMETRAKELKDVARQELKAMPFGDSIAGKTNDQVVCKASWVKGRQSVKVDDEQALLEWVKQNHPTEIVESVNAAYVKTFKAVGGVVIDSTGEPVPGMKVAEGDPYITVKANAETPFLIAQLMKSGLVSLDGAQELEA